MSMSPLNNVNISGKRVYSNQINVDYKVNRGVATENRFSRYFVKTIKSEIDGKCIYLNKKSCFNLLYGDLKGREKKRAYKEFTKFSNVEIINKIQSIFDDGDGTKRILEKVDKIVNDRKSLGGSDQIKIEEWFINYQELTSALTKANLTIDHIISDNDSLKSIFEDKAFRYAILRHFSTIDNYNPGKVAALELYAELITNKISNEYAHLDMNNHESVRANLPKLIESFAREGLHMEWVQEVPTMNDILTKAISTSPLAPFVEEYEIQAKALTDLRATAKALADRDRAQGQDLVTRLGLEAKREDVEALRKETIKIFFQLHPNKKANKTDQEQKRFDDASDLNDLIKNETYNYYLTEFKNPQMNWF